jgi:hypothetical protein
MLLIVSAIELIYTQALGNHQLGNGPGETLLGNVWNHRGHGISKATAGEVQL